MGAAELGLLAVPCAFGVVSGFNDGGSLLASFTAGRVISPRAAWLLLLCALLGPVLVGTQVARTVGVSVIDLTAAGTTGFVVIVALAVAVVLGSWRVRVPTSMTLALVGAMVGWALADAPRATVRWDGVAKVVVGIPVSVVAGIGLGFAVYRLARRLFASLPHARVLRLARYQYVTCGLQAVAYGSNDMEKTIGLVVVAEVLAGASREPDFESQAALLLAFGSFALGALLGGWRVARRVGTGVFRARPLQAMSEQLTSGSVVAALAAAGAPVSSTQTIAASLVGVGASVRPAGVGWGLVREMLASWAITLPAALAGAFVLHLALQGILGVR